MNADSLTKTVTGSFKALIQTAMKTYTKLKNERNELNFYSRRSLTNIIMNEDNTYIHRLIINKWLDRIDADNSLVHHRNLNDYLLRNDDPGALGRIEQRYLLSSSRRNNEYSS